MSTGILGIVVDLSPCQWDVKLRLDSLSLLINAMKLIQQAPELVLLVTGPGLSPTRVPHSPPTALREAISSLDPGHESGPNIAGSLSLLLCRPTVNRIIVLSAAYDDSGLFVPMMNAVFAAQKRGVIIDACILHGEHDNSSQLQQATHLTGGIFLRPESDEPLPPQLIMSFLADSATREGLCLPRQSRVDFRATCACHQALQDRAFVCSVCLSAFCEPANECDVCGTRYPPPHITGAKRKDR